MIASSSATMFEKTITYECHPGDSLEAHLMGTRASRQLVVSWQVDPCQCFPFLAGARRPIVRRSPVESRRLHRPASRPSEAKCSSQNMARYSCEEGRTVTGLVGGSSAFEM